MQQTFEEIDLHAAIVHLESVITLRCRGRRVPDPKELPQATIMADTQARYAHARWLLAKARTEIMGDNFEMANRWLGWAEGILEMSGIAHSEIWGMHQQRSQEPDEG